MHKGLVCNNSKKGYDALPNRESKIARCQAMKLSKITFVLLSFLMTGCYRISPEEDYISTIPITNNRQAMPGIHQAAPFPAVF
ncbi:MAG: hypothetical protein QRY71_02265 [Candidatus Rhabdochlamydia sp.]